MARILHVAAVAAERTGCGFAGNGSVTVWMAGAARQQIADLVA